MTQPTDTPSPTAMPAHLPDAEAEHDDRAPKTPEWYETEITKLRRENANWRTKLREAEATIEQAATQLGAMRHAEIERLAADHLKDASDVWQAQSDPDAFLDEYGAVDPAKVAKAAQSLTEQKPHYAADKRAAPPPTSRPIEGLRAGASPETGPPTQPTWADVIPRPPGSRIGSGE